MSTLALGCVQFGLQYGITNRNGRMCESEARRIIRESYRHGVDMLDVASSYGNAEEVLGQLGVSEFKVVTKLPFEKPSDMPLRLFMRSELVASLSRLAHPSAYGVLFHNVNQLYDESPDAVRSAIEHVKASQLTSKIGVSVYSPSELSAVFEVFTPDIVQLPMNALDRRFEATQWIDRLYDIGVEVHARSVFLQGLLLIEQDELPTQFLPWNDTFIKWNEFVHSNNLSHVGAAISAVNSQKVTRLVVGVQSLNQLNEVVQAHKKTIDLVVPDFEVSDTRLILPTEWN